MSPEVPHPSLQNNSVQHGTIQFMVKVKVTWSNHGYISMQPFYTEWLLTTNVAITSRPKPAKQQWHGKIWLTIKVKVVYMT
jgi:hypothetical protein